MHSSKPVQNLVVGDLIFHGGCWKRVERTEVGKFTVLVCMEGDYRQRLGIDFRVRYRTANEHKAHEALETWSKASKRLSARVKSRREANIAKRSSQKGTPNRKKGASPSKTQAFASWAVGIVAGFLLSGYALVVAREIGIPPLGQLALGVIWWVSLGWFVHDLFEDLRIGSVARKNNEALRKLMQSEMARHLETMEAKVVVHKELDDALGRLVEARNEIVELVDELSQLRQTNIDTGLSDFVQGFNTAGVDVALGGADPFGPQAEAILKFPVIKLHEQLTHAFQEGWEDGKEESGARVTMTETNEYKARAERQVWMWIQAMTEGKR